MPFSPLPSLATSTSDGSAPRVSHREVSMEMSRPWQWYQVTSPTACSASATPGRGGGGCGSSGWLGGTGVPGISEKRPERPSRRSDMREPASIERLVKEAIELTSISTLFDSTVVLTADSWLNTHFSTGSVRIGGGRTDGVVPRPLASSNIRMLTTPVASSNTPMSWCVSALASSGVRRRFAPSDPCDEFMTSSTSRSLFLSSSSRCLRLS
mmetsp:Transcript_24530/g.61891  ORF Transcript_24530/g.61891 Transcript_24530/m.61891 type:complete len:211 (-) Transcript_24530:224-856(-)